MLRTLYYDKVNHITAAGRKQVFSIAENVFFRRDLRRKSIHRPIQPGDSHAGLITGSEWPVMGAQFPRLSLWGSAYERTVASLDKGTHARRTFRHAFRCVIVLDLRQQACVLCLAKTAPERPAGLRVFPEDKRQPARQTRQMGCRPSTRITKPDVVWTRENHVCSCQATLSFLMDSPAGRFCSTASCRRMC